MDSDAFRTMWPTAIASQRNQDPPDADQVEVEMRRTAKPGYQEKGDSFKENNTMSTATSFNPQHEVSGEGTLRMNTNATPPSVPHPNREHALKRARLAAGFPNIVNGQRVERREDATFMSLYAIAPLPRLFHRNHLVEPSRCPLMHFFSASTGNAL